MRSRATLPQKPVGTCKGMGVPANYILFGPRYALLQQFLIVEKLTVKDFCRSFSFFRVFFWFTIENMSNFHLTSETGLLGEALARKYLQTKGHRVLAENYYFGKGLRRGEIDLVTFFQGCYRFVEVKTRIKKYRKQDSLPLASRVDRKKLLKMEKVAQQYLTEVNKKGAEYHFDLVTVEYFPQAKTAKIQYLEDIFC
jgi:putative endonuclease